jgi:protein-S-isoprenylcysteine O-methyltransferase Ste14
MHIYPPLSFSFLNGFLLIIPLLILRFGIPAIYGKNSQKKVDYFPPVQGNEQIALNVYFISNTFLIFSPIFSRIRFTGLFSTIGWIIYGIGIILFSITIFEFSKSGKGFTRTGIYRVSRNPMYIGYFLIFFGVALLIGSWTHLIMTLIYQISVHFLVLSEERWCVKSFGKDYIDYYNKVARYL